MTLVDAIFDARRFAGRAEAALVEGGRAESCIARREGQNYQPGPGKGGPPGFFHDLGSRIDFPCLLGARTESIAVSKTRRHCVIIHLNGHRLSTADVAQDHSWSSPG